MNKLLAPLLALLLFSSLGAFAQRPSVWIDADTGNEIDDLYALVRLLNEPGLNIVGLSSAHFNNADLVVFPKWNQYGTAGIQTVSISQQLNEELLRAMGRLAIAHPLGLTADGPGLGWPRAPRLAGGAAADCRRGTTAPPGKSWP